MLSIRELKEKINDVFPDPQREVLLDFADVLDSTVKVSDFNELKSIVADLAKSQKELAEAQKRTEERLNSLTVRVEELAEAQKRTEMALSKLAEEHEKTRTHLGSLTHTVGYFLENEAYKYLPSLLKRDFNLEVTGDLKRDYIEVRKNTYEEINIIGKAQKNGKDYIVLGEAKTQLFKADIGNFLKKIKKIENLITGEKFLLLVTHQAHPTVRKYAQEKGLKIYFSYEFK
ncbi:MAG: chordopoxvirus fusion protein [Candidatus Omnitrophica bacterium]|nr:chordopoxvirus fusion protein [Candidatus Omnitrophota bacterium]